VEQSVDALLAHDSSSSSSSGNMSDSRMQINTQVRSRDATGRLVVQFESPAAAKHTLAAADLVAAAAAGADAGNGDSAAAAAVCGGGLARGFAGGWLVDLLHAAVHKSIERAAGFAAS
jgi:hypothetical protein